MNIRLSKKKTLTLARKKYAEKNKAKEDGLALFMKFLNKHLPKVQEAFGCDLSELQVKTEMKGQNMFVIFSKNPE